MIFEAQRPIVLNGINETATRSDLVDRTVSVNLRRIPPAKRRSESELEKSLKEDSPFLFGFLLNTLSGHLANQSLVNLDNPPRMIDFAITGESVAMALGFPKNSFTNSFLGSQTDANENIVDASPIGEPLRRLLLTREEWIGTISELLSELRNGTDEEILRRRDWPKDAARLGRILRPLAPSFRSEGINLDFNTPSRRLITITKITENTVTAVIQSEKG